jgi:hypothetical protein
VELLEDNPHTAHDPFVFYGLLENKPMDAKLLVNGLKEACSLAGIDAAARGIVFHSHRHYYAARMADIMTADKITRITRITGHKSRAVFEEYADHVTNENLEEAGSAAGRVFSNILQFRKKGGVNSPQGVIAALHGGRSALFKGVPIIPPWPYIIGLASNLPGQAKRIVYGDT